MSQHGMGPSVGGRRAGVRSAECRRGRDPQPALHGGRACERGGGGETRGALPADDLCCPSGAVCENRSACNSNLNTCVLLLSTVCSRVAITWPSANNSQLSALGSQLSLLLPHHRHSEGADRKDGCLIPFVAKLHTLHGCPPSETAPTRSLLWQTDCLEADHCPPAL
eukprot:COSAG01_NODE_1178_length_11365_cov_22.270613_9_plen_167_part_00